MQQKARIADARKTFARTQGAVASNVPSCPLSLTLTNQHQAFRAQLRDKGRQREIFR